MTSSISLSGVSKHYRKYDDTARLGGRLGQLFVRTERSWLAALTDVDLTVEPGESVGIIGRNGAGKSTLLQLLCGVTAPTSGTVRVLGRVAPLISVGVGFHPEMTGRENVYVNGTILGMTRQQINARFDDVVAFAELGSFIDTPVKFYSSGMFVRLGFAIAVEARPDVLLIDEVLAVGDFAFQVRCFERMREIRDSGTTIVVVSHNMNSIRGFCSRSVVLHGGKVAFDGPVFDGVARYFDLAAQDSGDAASGADPALEVEAFTLLDASGRPATHLRSGEEAVFEVRASVLRDVSAPFLWLGIESGMGVVVYSDARLDEPMAPLTAGEHVVFQIRATLRLPSGNYSADVAVHDSHGNGRSSVLVRAPRLQFYVTGRNHVHGAADLQADFTRLGGSG